MSLEPSSLPTFTASYSASPAVIAFLVTLLIILILLFIAAEVYIRWPRHRHYPHSSEREDFELTTLQLRARLAAPDVPQPPSAHIA